jgi:two-component system phosphate regulon response regulator PhoB
MGVMPLQRFCCQSVMWGVFLNRAINVLVVDGEVSFRERLSSYLQEREVTVAIAPSAAQAWEQLQSGHKPDIVLLAWTLTDMDGIELLRKIRAKKRLRRVPVVMMSQRDDEESAVNGLNSGADDYLIKPFSFKEMLARLRVVLRRVELPGMESEVLSLAGVRVDVGRHKVFVQEKRAHLSPTEFRLLHFLISHPEQVFSRSQLIEYVWTGMVVEERTVDQHIRRLRKVLRQRGGTASLIRTVRGVGYLFQVSANP